MSDGYIRDSYVDIELSNQDDAIGDRASVGEDDVVEKQTAEMQGSAAETNMDGFDFSDTWSVVESRVEIDGLPPAEDGYPILQNIDTETQFEAQGIEIATLPPVFVGGQEVTGIFVNGDEVTDIVVTKG